MVLMVDFYGFHVGTNIPCMDSMGIELGGGFKYYICSPPPGKMIQFDEHIFQWGWFNHQL